MFNSEEIKEEEKKLAELLKIPMSEREFEIYNRGLKYGQLHAKPSEATFKMFDGLKGEVKSLIHNHCIADSEEHKKLRNDYLAEIKKINDTLYSMSPTVSKVKNLQQFFTTGKDLGLGLVVFITICGTLYGAIYAIKAFFSNEK